MAVRDDIRVNWALSPRIITILAPSTEVTIQDLHDTLTDLEDEPPALAYDQIISTSGDEPLGSGVYVGLTATLLNAQIAFEARPGPDWVLCTIRGGNIVAIDANGAEIDVRKPTAFTSVDRAASSSATQLSQEDLLRLLRNKTVTDPATGIMTIYDEDGVTPLWTANIYEDATGLQPYRSDGIERRERLE